MSTGTIIAIAVGVVIVMIIIAGIARATSHRRGNVIANKRVSFVSRPRPVRSKRKAPAPQPTSRPPKQSALRQKPTNAPPRRGRDTLTQSDKPSRLSISPNPPVIDMRRHVRSTRMQAIAAKTRQCRSTTNDQATRTLSACTPSAETCDVPRSQPSGIDRSTLLKLAHRDSERRSRPAAAAAARHRRGASCPQPACLAAQASA